MPKLAFLPMIIAAITAMLTWAMAKHMELSQAQRARAAHLPRSRPYATKLPDCLLPHGD